VWLGGREGARHWDAGYRHALCVSIGWDLVFPEPGGLATPTGGRHVTKTQRNLDNACGVWGNVGDLFSR
jgi:hypothetical protein